MVPTQSAADSSKPQPSAPSGLAAPGDVLGDFVLLRLLGRGGMAEVWLAEQTSLKRNVALKLLKPELMSDEVYVKRFQAEAKAAGGLSHPNIVQVYSIGQADGRHFIAQEYVQGSTLKSFLQKRGALDAQTALHVMRQVAGALQAASERGIVHRDIKPENIMLTRKGEVKVADFGLAQLMGGERLNLTQEGTTMGTPLYMSPEQVNGQKLDQRSDLYSFGVTCYHMLAGETPFRGESAIAVAMKHLQSPPPELSTRRPDLPPALCRIVHRMLQKDPDERYPNAQLVQQDLKTVMRSLREAGQADSLELSVFEAPLTAPSLALRRPVLVLSSLMVFVAAASAALGWWRYPEVPKSIGSPVPVKGTAKEQFQYALMAVDDEDAFKAVKERFPFEKTWTARADEQLTLLYLKDVVNPARQRTIEKQIAELAADGDFSKQYAIEAAIAEAYMEVRQGRPELASNALTKHNLFGPPPDSVQGSWRTLLSEAQNAINRRGTESSGGPDAGDRNRRGGPGGGRQSPDLPPDRRPPSASFSPTGP